MVFKSLVWVFISRWLNRLLSLGRLLILARLLSPTEFGRFAIATLVLALLEILTETSVNVFLIQQEGKVDKYISTAWVVSICRGLLISFLIILSSPLIAQFFNSPDSFVLLLIISLTPFIRGFVNPSVVRLQKELLFKTEFYYQTVLFIIESIAILLLALYTHSAVALVLGMLIAACAEVILSNLIFSPKPRLTLDYSHLKAIVSSGKWVSAAGIFNYFYQHTDDIAVGKMLGEHSLGLYQYAYKISSLPLTEVGDVFSRVTFPFYTQIKNDKKRLKKMFLTISISISSISLVFGVCLAIFSYPLVYYLLGNQWILAVPVLQLLSIYGVFKTVTGTTFPLFLALKKQKYVTYVTLASFLILVITIIPAILKWGIVGAGFSAILGTVLSAPLAIYWSYKLIK